MLITAYQHPGAALNEIAEHVVLDRQTTAEITSRLVVRGLLEQRRSESDRRAYAMWATAAGEALLQEVMPQDSLVEAEVLAVLPEEYRPLFLKCLRLMTEGDPDPSSQQLTELQ